MEQLRSCRISELGSRGSPEPTGNHSLPLVSLGLCFHRLPAQQRSCRGPLQICTFCVCRRPCWLHPGCVSPSRAPRRGPSLFLLCCTRRAAGRLLPCTWQTVLPWLPRGPGRGPHTGPSIWLQPFRSSCLFVVCVVATFLKESYSVP